MIKSEPVQPSQNPLIILKGVLLLMSLLFGAFGMFFFIWKQNYSAASSCLTLEVVSVLLLQLTSTVMKGKLHEAYSQTRLKFVFILAIVIGVVEFVASLSYVSLGAMYHQEFQLEDHGYYVATIPSSLASIWSFLLAYESRTYMREFSIGGTTTMAQF